MALGERSWGLCHRVEVTTSGTGHQGQRGQKVKANSCA